MIDPEKTLPDGSARCCVFQASKDGDTLTQCENPVFERGVCADHFPQIDPDRLPGEDSGFVALSGDAAATMVGIMAAQSDPAYLDAARFVNDRLSAAGSDLRQSYCDIAKLDAYALQFLLGVNSVSFGVCHIVTALEALPANVRCSQYGEIIRAALVYLVKTQTDLKERGYLSGEVCSQRDILQSVSAHCEKAGFSSED